MAAQTEVVKGGECDCSRQGGIAEGAARSIRETASRSVSPLETAIQSLRIMIAQNGGDPEDARLSDAWENSDKIFAMLLSHNEQTKNDKAACHCSQTQGHFDMVAGTASAALH